MLGLMGFFSDSKWAKRQREYEQECNKKRMELAVPWTDKTRYLQEGVNIKASTYHPLNLFPEVESCGDEHWEATKKQRAISPSGSWLYVNKRLRKGVTLRIMQGSRESSVIFDGQVIIPCLYDKKKDGEWGRTPFMSLTPMEIFTLRPGTRLAKDHTIVAGLGLGHQLIEVCKRKSVKRVTLVEQSAELVEWMLPRVQPHLSGRQIEVVVGDAMKVLPTLTADVALVDIFDGYGNNHYERDDLLASCKTIKKLWCWGSAVVG